MSFDSPQAHRGRLVSDDGSLDRAGGTRCAPAPKSDLHDGLRRSVRAQSFGQKPQDLSPGNLPKTQNRPQLCLGPKQKVCPPCSTHPHSGLSMWYDEFIAWNRGLLRHPPKPISRRHRQATAQADPSAIHRRLGAQVALRQSLPAAKLPHPQHKEFCHVPVDNTHTRLPGAPPAGPRNISQA